MAIGGQNLTIQGQHDETQKAIRYMYNQTIDNFKFVDGELIIQTYKIGSGSQSSRQFRINPYQCTVRRVTKDEWISIPYASMRDA